MLWQRNSKKINVPITQYLDELIAEELAKGRLFRVSVGTDSQTSGRDYKFATVILITTKEDLGGGTIVGRGGKFMSAVYHVKMNGKKKEGVNERMLIEVGKSIEVAYEIAPILDKYGIKLEVHADINPDPRWESNKALSQAIGYILGMGYDFKIKPESIAASYCSDRMAK